MTDEKGKIDINITWDGPYTLSDLEDKGCSELNGNTSYGIYQIYGSHPVYGSDVLLYIGKAEQQTFHRRINQEAHWWDNSDRHNVKIYVGKLFSKEKVNNEIWGKHISLAERLLIYSHRPAHNSSNINTLSKKEEILDSIKNVRVINYHYYRSLMPEVSGDIYIGEEVYKDEYIYTYE